MLIETRRCLIRNFEEKDINKFMSYRNDEFWMQYQGFKGLTKQEYKKVLLKEVELYEGTQFAIVLKDSGCLIGDIYLKQEADSLWLGYTISPLHARRGYAYEAVNGMITRAREKGIDKIFAAVLLENIPSINLLKKLKFSFVGMNEHGEGVYTLDFNKMRPLGIAS